MVSNQSPIVSSTSEMSSQRSDWREQLRANPSRMELELAFKLQENQVRYQTQVEIPVTIADFYFSTEPRPLLVFIDGRVHLGKTQAAKDEEGRTVLRKKGYRVLELRYENYSDKKRDQLCQEILTNLGNEQGQVPPCNITDEDVFTS